MGIILGLLGRVPFLIWPLLAALAWGAWNHHAAKAEEAKLQKINTDIVLDNLRESEKAQDETNRRLRAASKIYKDKSAEAAKYAAVAASAADANGKLRKRIDEILAQAAAASDSTATAERKAITNLGTALGECAEKYREMARIAEDARRAGSECENLYDSLTKDNSEDKQ